MDLREGVISWTDIIIQILMRFFGRTAHNALWLPLNDKECGCHADKGSICAGAMQTGISKAFLFAFAVSAFSEVRPHGFVILTKSGH
jgi:hypothetical protein